MEEDKRFQIPAYCEKCELLFPSPFIISLNSPAPPMVTGGGLFMMGNITNCPKCKSDARMMDGIFTQVGDTLKVLSQPGFNNERFKKLFDILRVAQKSGEGPKDLAEAINKHAPEFGGIKLQIPDNMKDFKVWLYFILFIVAMLVKSCSNDSPIIINNIYNAPNIIEEVARDDQGDQKS